ncbi:MAG: DCC1-like thiol-disulfide oxidoreductase family protein [Terracidiphilus sp.]
MSSLQELGSRQLVIYDGHCGLCNRSVRWLLVRDLRDRMRFAPSESPDVAELLARYESANQASASLQSIIPDSIVVARNPGTPAEQILIRSDAVLALLAELPSPWPAIASLLRWIPRPLRDLGYRLIARWRYRIWGRIESCPIPTPAERARFL